MGDLQKNFDLTGFSPTVQAAIETLRKKPTDNAAKITSYRLTGQDLEIHTGLGKTTGLNNTELAKRGLRALRLLEILLDSGAEIKGHYPDGTTSDLTGVAKNLTNQDKKPTIKAPAPSKD